MIRVAIVDDHQMFIDGIRALLSTEKGVEVVGESSNGAGILESYATWKPDVILMDINMPGKDGLETLAELFKQDVGAKVIMLTMFNDHAYINRAMTEGASGYVMKNAGRIELMQAIQKVVAGEKHFGEEAIQAYLSQFTAAKRQKEQNAPPAPSEILTKRELEVLVLVAEEFTSQEIAEELFISLHTVETHRKNIMSKLDVKNTVGLARYAIQHGLVVLD